MNPNLPNPEDPEVRASVPDTDAQQNDRRELLRKFAWTNFALLVGGASATRASAAAPCLLFDTPPPPKDGCGTYDPNGFLVMDLDCNYKGNPGDHDCNKQIQKGGPADVASDDDCGSIGPQGYQKDSDCSKVMAQGSPTIHHSDSACGRLPGKDADCGLIANENYQVFTDNTAT